MGNYFRRALVFLLLLSMQASAKDYFKENPHFIEDNLKQTSYSLDTSASAIVLYEKYTYDMTSMSAANTIMYRVKKIVKILKKSGIHFADVDVHVYNSKKHYSKIRKISAIAYNLDNGVITEDKLDEDNIDKGIYEHVQSKKFSIPSVREGSIIEYNYEIEEETGLTLGDWKIQGELPKLYSELEVRVPEYLEVITLSQNVPEFREVNKNKEDTQCPDAYVYSDHDQAHDTYRNWVRRNIPALEDEPFVYDLDKYGEDIGLMIKGIMHQTGYADERYSTWEKINDYLLKSPDFYKAILDNNSDVAYKTKTLIAGIKDTLEQAQKIFDYIRNSMTMQESGQFLIKNHPADVLKNKAGSVTEINMLLTEMLQDAGIDCDPVILSTRENGMVTLAYPDLDEFDYTVCRAIIGGQKYYLDASIKYNPFGTLPLSCYNGYARLVNDEKGDTVLLNPNSVKEKNFVKIVTENNAASDYTLSVTVFFGPSQAMNYREKWAGDSTKVKKFVTSFLKEMPQTTHLKKYDIQNLRDPNKQLTLNFSYSVEWPANANIVYLSPFFYQYFDSNPFTGTVRKYPVELPYKYDINYYLSLQLPKGYNITVTVAPLNLRFGDNAVYRDALAYDKETNTLTVNSYLRISKTFFKKEDFVFLKEFFEKMLSQQQQNVVLKKTD